MYEPVLQSISMSCMVTKKLTFVSESHLSPIALDLLDLAETKKNLIFTTVGMSFLLENSPKVANFWNIAFPNLFLCSPSGPSVAHVSVHLILQSFYSMPLPLFHFFPHHHPSMRYSGFLTTIFHSLIIPSDVFNLLFNTSIGSFSSFNDYFSLFEV